MNAHIHTDDRTRGILPVRQHLRPTAGDTRFPALFERGDEGYLFVSDMDLSDAVAVQVGGEA
jgi:hypothetical protein